jgi:heat shock protein HtpX
MAAYGLYSHIASNKRRSVLLLIGLFFLIYLMVFAGALIGEGFIMDHLPFEQIVARAWRDLIVAFPFATIGTAIWIAIAYRFHQAMIDALTGGREVTREEQPRLYNLLENLCISRGIPMPKLKVMDSDALNAFATGLN